MSIGYACIGLGVPGTGQKTCALKTVNDENLRELIRHNLRALGQLLDYNRQHKIRLFRISSDIIPFGSHPANRLDWEQEFEEELHALGEKVREGGIRVSMHPGQYTVLNSPREDVAENAIRDLEYHAAFLDSLGAGENCKIILHGGGTYGDIKAASDRFAENFKQLSGRVGKRLVLENDERNFGIADILALAGRIGVPAVYDNLHNALNPSDGATADREWIRACAATWKETDGRQKIHYSQQQKGGRPGAHSDTIRVAEFLEFCRGLGDILPDIMLEVKDKNISAVKCINCTDEDLKITALEEDWERYKYSVLGRSGTACATLGEMLKDGEKPDASAFYGEIEKALSIPEDPDSEKNAALHVWDCFGNAATAAEKRKFEDLLRKYLEGSKKLEAVKAFLQQQAFKYNATSLYESYYFAL